MSGEDPTRVIGQIRWRCMVASVRGAAHERSGSPNQDHVAWKSLPVSGEPMLLCLSDGHGSARYFRSDIGSALAVEVGLATLQKFLEEAENLGSEARRLTLIEKAVEEKLSQDIVKTWREAVRKHYDAHGFTEEELGRVRDKEGEPAVRELLADSVTAYGATFLGIGVTQEFAFFVQDGDGDILAVNDAREPLRVLAEDSRLFANATTSLCDRNAWKNFRTRFQVLGSDVPALILASTDGYVNSFETKDDFQKVGVDILDLLHSEGFDYVASQLEAWLMESSAKGSGDDISVGLFWRTTSDRPEEEQTGVEAVIAGDLKTTSEEVDRESTAEEGGQGLYRNWRRLFNRGFSWRRRTG